MKHGDFEHLGAKFERARSLMTLSIWVCLVICIGIAFGMLLLSDAGDGYSYFSTRTKIFALISVARLIDFVFKLIAGFAFLKWLCAAVRNAKKFHPYEVWPEGYWVLACWFVPLLNLYSPFLIMHNLLASVEPEHSGRHRNKLVLWWLCYTLQNPVISFLWTTIVNANILNVRFLVGGVEPIVSGLLYALAGYFLLPLMNAITNAQERTFATADTKANAIELTKLSAPPDETAPTDDHVIHVPVKELLPKENA